MSSDRHALLTLILWGIVLPWLVILYLVVFLVEHV